MSEKHLHIVTHNVPWPVDFGGLVDLFYKIKTLHHLGVKIHLHCFTQGRPPQPELDRYCESVRYYQRQKNVSHFSLRLPFIVNSRKCKELISDLENDCYPVLLEGIHCTYYLHAGKLEDRKVVVRLHNAEFEYYHRLAMHEIHLFKKWYFKFESWLLKKYEEQLSKKALLVAVSEQDVEHYRHAFDAANIHYLPVFLPYTLSAGKEGKGCFCLYHGNLSVNENEKAAIWLLQNIFNELQLPFVIAGKDPSQKLEILSHEYKHACLVANPSEKELQDLIAKAQINILPSFNNTGIKLKLLNALFNGRHCIVNQAGVEGSGLEAACHIAEDAGGFKSLIRQLYMQPFTEQEIQLRQGLLQRLYNNEANAKQLMSWIY